MRHVLLYARLICAHARVLVLPDLFLFSVFSCASTCDAYLFTFRLICS